MTTLWAKLRAITYRWRRRAAWERALDDELQAYLDQQIDARIAAGMSPAEARRTALAEFGGVEQVKEQVRTGATGAGSTALRQDLRYAVRALQVIHAATPSGSSAVSPSGWRSRLPRSRC